MQTKHIEMHHTRKQLRGILNFGTAPQRRLAHQVLDLMDINDELHEILNLEAHIDEEQAA